MITDINTYRHKQKITRINELIKELMTIRSKIRGLKIEESQLRDTIKELAKELDWREPEYNVKED
ncbi:hypothetical protein [Desulforamulus reducens]|uniref:hypothetical protein n=1 Tax=Desulforamulus reducens TaxID=59610 RepID=UPI0002E722E6|nr:hypothetical protein [Desulforamulus reducens]